MSTVDDRIVKMQFDNSGFSQGVDQTTKDLDKLDKALKLDGASAGLDELKTSISSFEMDSVSSAVEQVGNRFSMLQEIATGALRRIGERAVDLGADLLKKATIQPLIDGFGEYETQMRSIQTISANTGLKGEEGIATINAALDELNEYADQTIYNFTEMTKNIGTFTAAGVDLDTATGAIQGIANLGAVSGSTSQQVSTAMYQLSQALASGTVKLQDWNSVVNAGMGGEVFQEALKRTARNHGIAVDEMIEANGSFRESLKDGWLTSEVLTDTLNQLTLSYGEVGDEAYNAGMEMLRNAGYSEEDAVAILELAKTAQEAATKVRTWSQLWDTVGEALGSGWAQTWRIIIGDFNKATELFTFFSEKITGIINASAESRNKMLQIWANAGGRSAFVGGLINSWEAAWRIVSPIVDAFGRVFSVTGKDLAIATENLARFIDHLVLSEKDADRLGAVFEGVFKLIHDTIGTVLDLFSGINLNSVVDMFNDVVFIFLDGIDIVQSFGQAILGLLDATHIIPLIGEGIGFVVDRIADALDVVRRVIDAITGVVAPFFDVISDISHIVNDVFGVVLDKLSKSEMFRGIADGFEAIRKGVSDFIDAVLHPLETIHNFLEGVHQFLMNFHSNLMKQGPMGRNMLEWLGLNYSNDLEGITAFVTDVINQFGKALGDFLGISDIFTAKIEDFPLVLQPVVLIFGAVGTAVDGAVKAIANGVDTIKGLKPSKVAADLENLFSGEWFSSFKGVLSSISPSLGDKLQNLIDDIIGWFKNLAEQSDSFSQIFIDAWNNVVNFITGIPEKIGGFFSKIVDFFANSTDPIGDAIQIVKDKISGLLDSITGMFSNTTNPFENAIGSFKDNLKGVGDSIKGIFSGGEDSLESSGTSLIDKVQGFTTKVSAVFKSGEEDVNASGTSLMDKIIAFFTNLWPTVKEKASSIIENLKNFTKDFMANLPSPNEIGQSLANIKNGFGEFFNGLFSDTSGTSIGEGLKTEIEEGFNNESASSGWNLDFGGFFLGLFDGLAAAIDEIITNDHLGHIIERLSGYLTTIVGVVLALKLNSLAKTMQGAFKNFGGAFKEMGSFFKEAKDGLSLMKQTITVFPPETKFDAFLKICLGIVAVAGAIWLVVDAINKGGSGALDQAVGSLAIMIALAAALLIFFSILGSERFSALNFTGIGASFGGIGLAMLAIAAALWIMCQIPFNQAMQAIVPLGILMLALAALFWSIKNDAKAYAGAAAAFVAMALAVNLMIIPIMILGVLPLPILVQGGIAALAIAAILATIAAIATKFAGKKAHFAGFAAAMIAMALAIDLMLIPILVLAHQDPYEVTGAVLTISLLLIVMSLFAGIATSIGGKASTFVAFGAAMIAMAIAVDLMIIPIGILAILDKDGKLSDAILAVGLLIVVMGLVAALMASVAQMGGAGGMVAMAAGLLLVAVAVDALAVAFLLMQQVDFGKIWVPLLIIVAAFAALVAVCAAFGPVVGPALLMAGGGLALFGLGCLAVAGAIWLIADSLDTFAEMAPEKAAKAGEAMGSALAGVIHGFATTMGGYLGELIGGLLEGVLTLAQGFIAGGLAIVNWIGEGINSAGNWLQEQAANIVGVDLMNGVEPAAKESGGFIGKTVTDEIFDSIDKAKGKSSTASEELLSSLTSGITAGRSDVKNAAETGINEPINESMDELNTEGTTTADQYVDNLIQSLTNGEGFSGAMDINMGSYMQPFLDEHPELMQMASDAGLDLPEMLKQPEAYGQAANENMNGPSGYLTILAETLQGRGIDLATASKEDVIDALRDEGAFQEAGFADAEAFNNYLGQKLPEGVEIADLSKEQILDLLKDPESFEYVAAEDQEAAKRGFAPIVEGLFNHANNAATGALGALSKQAEFFSTSSSVEGSVVAPFTNLANDVSALVTNATTEIENRFTAPNYEGTSQGVVNRVASGFSTLPQTLGSIASSGAATFASTLANFDSSGSGRALADRAASGARYGDFRSAGYDAAVGFAGGMSDYSWIVENAAASVAHSAVSSMRAALNSSSPSKVTMDIGKDTVEGFAIGIDNNAYMAAQSAEDLGKVVPDALGNGLTSLKDSLNGLIEDGLDTDPVIRPVLDLSNVNEEAQILSSLLNGGSQDYSLSGILKPQDPLGLSSLGSIDTTSRELADKIDQLRSDLQAYTEAAAKSAVVMDSGALVGQLVPSIDVAMGQRQVMASRGVI